MRSVKEMTIEELQEICQKYRSAQFGVSFNEYFKALEELRTRVITDKNGTLSGGSNVPVHNVDYIP